MPIALIFSLIEEGLVDGLRIDHVDGLLDPKGYLETLRATSPRPIYLIVEKILAPHERLRADWPIDGTTGYEVGAQLTRRADAGRRPRRRLPRPIADFVGRRRPTRSRKPIAANCASWTTNWPPNCRRWRGRFAAIAWSVRATAT